jgi:hypothetical protein
MEKFEIFIETGSGYAESIGCLSEDAYVAILPQLEAWAKRQGFIHVTERKV